jgi:hypothetical protein
MSVDRKNEATDVEDTNHLSRRSFLVRLAVVGIGSAIATSACVNAAHAAADSEIASRAKDLTDSETSPANKTAEVIQQVDPKMSLSSVRSETALRSRCSRAQGPSGASPARSGELELTHGK